MSSSSKTIKKEATLLAQWFAENARPLPWRETRDPYAIWISEIMLQQTTVKAVIPFFERFIKRFADVESLAEAKIEEVYTYWAGLGYYSRARNIHAAAQQIVELGDFPQTFEGLLKLKGFGDYTSRAVSSQAFAEKVGVVDGNVIRVLSRRFALPVEHWKNKEKKQLQDLADEYAQHAEPSTINQAFMELGATICTPKNPSCLLCPIKKNCEALKQDKVEELPLSKPRKTAEIWVWEAEVFEKNGALAFIENDYAPFLKKQLLLPGKVSKKSTPPKTFDFQHAITHHKIYVKIKKNKTAKNPKDFTWIKRKNIKEKIPFSLVQKVLNHS